jgi:3-oxoacyl-[acyl-carrier protein] reductase
VAFLCSDHASWVTGQIFGTGNDRVAILEHPAYGSTFHKDGGWSVEDLVARFEGHFRSRLEPLGIMKRPYPFHEGVKPPAS